MGPASLFLKDPSGSRFVAGGLAELEALLGAPLPLLPPPERDGHREVFFVNVEPKLRTQLRRHLQALFTQIGASGADPRSDPFREQTDYEQSLARILRSVRASDRRQGLLNLFWLAHSKDVAEFLRELEAKNPAVRKAKYSLHPILSSTYRRLDQEGRKEKNGRVLGTENPALVESIIEDGFAFTETSVGRAGLHRVPEGQQALPPARRGLLGDPAGAGAGERSAGSARATAGSWRAPPATCPGCPATST